MAKIGDVMQFNKDGTTPGLRMACVCAVNADGTVDINIYAPKDPGARDTTVEGSALGVKLATSPADHATVGVCWPAS